MADFYLEMGICAKHLEFEVGGILWWLSGSLYLLAFANDFQFEAIRKGLDT